LRMLLEAGKTSRGNTKIFQKDGLLLWAEARRTNNQEVLALLQELGIEEQNHSVGNGASSSAAAASSSSSQTVSNDASAEASESSITLLDAARNGNCRVVTTLLKIASQKELVDNAKRTALHLAIINNQKAVVEILLREGVDIEARDAQDLRPLHYAAMNGNIEIMQALLTRGAIKDVWSQSTWFTNGWTPLYCAVYYGNTDAVEVLLKSGVEKSKNEILKSYAAIPYIKMKLLQAKMHNNESDVKRYSKILELFGFTS